MLILICGLPGVGKSTVGEMLRAKLKEQMIESDQLKPTKKIIDELKNKNFWAREVKSSVYNTLFSNGAKRLMNGQSVILNATFFKKAYVDQAKKLAELFKTKLYIIYVKCDEEITEKRIEARFKAKESEVTMKTYHIIKSRFEPIREQKIVVDNSGNRKELVKQINKIINKITSKK
ncbi:MAG: ATP-binding protein [Patescibacteria group bacterium]|jgi:hypothetical protein